MKYIIQIQKIPEKIPDNGWDRTRMPGRSDSIFHAEMNSDHAIQVLQILHDLQERERTKAVKAEE